MRKLERRAIICLILACFLFLGLLLFCFRFVTDGSEWVSFPANKHIFAEGELDCGSIYDKDGTLLLQNTENGQIYHSDSTIRKATLHAVGDAAGNIATGAETKFAGKLIGYNFVNGVYSMEGDGRNLYLTIDADVCAVAYKALNGRKGCVGVFDYTSGEVICAVSSPSYDPNHPVSAEAAEDEGYYINRLFSATFVPGSIFKTVTAAAVLETYPYENWSFTCDGSSTVGNDEITCVSAHGEVDLESALCKSCNGAFADLTMKLGADVMEDYVHQLKLTESYSVNGIQTAKGSFTFDESHPSSLGWAGVGQGEDLVNPSSMMSYMGAIGNNGRAITPQIISGVKTNGDFPLSLYIPKWNKKLIGGDTADELTALMRNNVVNNYGDGNFPGLTLCAKSGTAEVGDGTSHAWFAGFLDDPDHPYAFIVLVEHGGGGAKVAGPIANKVLQSVIKNE